MEEYSVGLDGDQKGTRMKTEEEIKDKLQWLIKALDDEDNQGELQQTKLWAQIDFIRWLGVKNG